MQKKKSVLIAGLLLSVIVGVIFTQITRTGKTLVPAMCPECKCMSVPSCGDLTGAEKGFPLVWRVLPEEQGYNIPETIESLKLKNDSKIAFIDFLAGFLTSFILLIAGNQAVRRKGGNGRQSQ